MESERGLQAKLLTPEPMVVERLMKAHYGIYAHGAVEICRWSKFSLKNRGECYKNRFYGIDTHRCMQFTPLSIWCQHNCIYCWRPIEYFRMREIGEDEVMEPEELMEGLWRERLRLLSGFGGDPNVDRLKLKESHIPSHYAISLSGEPTMYPKLPQLIQYLKRLPETRSIFLVTNGQEPEMLKQLRHRGALPTQLYLSMNASNKRAFQKIHLPEYRDGWERFLESLSLLPTLPTRTVVRLTLIRGYNTSGEELYGFAELLKHGSPHFIEVKSYMHIGGSIHRLTPNHMLSYEEVRDYGEKLASHLKHFKVIDGCRASRITLLQNTERHIEPRIK